MNSKNDEMRLGINQSNTIRNLFLDGVKCIPIQHFKYYLIHEKECYMLSDVIKHDCSSVLNDFKYAAL